MYLLLPLTYVHITQIDILKYKIQYLMNIYKEREVEKERAKIYTRKCKVLSLCDKAETTISH